MVFCKVCGKEFDNKKGVKTHARFAHDMRSKEYGELDKLIPDAAMIVWSRRPHIQKAFPEPGNMNLGHGRFKNFLVWVKTCGVRDYPLIKEAFSSENE